MYKDTLDYWIGSNKDPKKKYIGIYKTCSFQSKILTKNTVSKLLLEQRKTLKVMNKERNDEFKTKTRLFHFLCIISAL